MRILISGGGTGGHVFPAIAIADALKEEDPNVEILFVGAQGKLEMAKVPRAGYEIKGLHIAGFHRKKMWRNISFPFKLIRSMLAALKIVRGFRPDAAIGVGGYASGPTLKVSNWLGIPTFLQEQNSYAGVTNKLLAKKAEKIFVAYEGMNKFFDEEKINLVGNPVRDVFEKSSLSKNEARLKMEIPLGIQKVILVSGGSLGAKAINEAISGLSGYLMNHPEVFCFWQVGKLYIDEYQKKPIAALENVQMVDFIDDMNAAYTMADIVVCRAGALTISELMVVGKPAILMPSPNVAEDHQTHNAMALVKRDAAIIVRDEEAGEKLEKEVISLLADEMKRKMLSRNVSEMAKHDAAKVIAKDIKEYLLNK